MNIFFFGDSICTGQGVSLHQGWVPRISQDVEQLSARYKKQVTVINASANGDTTRLALERMPYDIQGHGIGMILIQFGLNDCNYWQTDKGVPRVSPKAFEANLNEIITRSKLFGAKRVFLNTNHPITLDKKFPVVKFNYTESNRRYNKIIRKVAKVNSSVILYDIERYFNRYLANHKLKSDSSLADGIHLNILGHELYHKFISPRLLVSLSKLI